MAIRTINVKAPVIKEVLERELICGVLEQLRTQKSPFKNGEQLVVLGSGIPMWEGYHDPSVTPYRRIASDLDFYVREPQGEVMTHESKDKIANQARAALKEAVEAIGGRMGEPDGELTGNNVYESQRTYTPEEITEIFKKPQARALLEKFYNAPPETEFTVALDKPMQVNAELDVICYPMSFLAPRRPNFSKTPKGDTIDILCDDTINTIALKLARIMMELPSNRSNGWMMAKTTDVQDIVDILHQRKEHGEPPVDMRLLKVLVLADIAHMRDTDRYHEANAMKTCPTAVESLDVIDTISGAKTHMDQLAKNICIVRKIALKLDDKNDWEKFRQTEQYAQAREMIEKVDGLIQEMFPTRAESKIGERYKEEGRQKMLPLTDNERYFVDYLRFGIGQATQNDIHDPYEVEAIKRLATEYGDVFEKYPELAMGICNSWCSRPAEPFIAGHRSRLNTPHMAQETNRAQAIISGHSCVAPEGGEISYGLR